MVINKPHIISAYNRIAPIINRTPIMQSSQINAITGANLYFKCENFQKVGAFKYRGANNALLSLPKERLKSGVATHSSGNHAQALALAANNLGVKAYIVMPSNSPKVKVEAVKGYGADIYFCEPTLQARETTLQQIVEKTGAEFVHPYDRSEIIAGQGTVALELLQEIPDLEVIIAPVGGGGLISGTAIYSKNFNPNIIIFAAEPSGANDAYQSFYSKTWTPSSNPKTICDGLLTSLGKQNFAYIAQYVDDVLITDDKQIIDAMKLIYERMKIIVEPSSAITLAVVLANPQLFENKKIGLILSGGNVDLENFFKHIKNKI